MFALLKTRTIADIRSGIGTSRDRLAVLLQFDLEILRRGGPLSPFLKTILVSCLRNGWPREKILKKYPVGRGVVQRLAREIDANTPDKKRLKIITLLKQGRTNLEIRNESGASNWLIKKLRGTFLGDRRDLRFGRPLSAGELDTARQMLRDGEPWKVVAAHFEVCEAKLKKVLNYRKHDDPWALIKLSREKHDAIIAALRSGKTRNSICRELQCSSWTVHRIQGELDARTTAG
jgi:DNA invertase Pin-like site-specific DNA recombinase